MEPNEKQNDTEAPEDDAAEPCSQPVPTFGDALIVGDNWTVPGPDAPGTYRNDTTEE